MSVVVLPSNPATFSFIFAYPGVPPQHPAQLQSNISFTVPVGVWTAATWRAVGNALPALVADAYANSDGSSVYLFSTGVTFDSGEVPVSSLQLAAIATIGAAGGAVYTTTMEMDASSYTHGGADYAVVTLFTLTLTGSDGVTIIGAIRPALYVANEADVLGSFPVKDGQIVNIGDLVGIDGLGRMQIANNQAAAISVANGVAFFNRDNSARSSFTGDGELQCTVARKAKIWGGNLDTTTLPGYARGAKLYLGVAGNSGVMNYTCIQPLGAGDKVQMVGYVDGDGVLQVDVTPETELVYQAAANAKVRFG